jgi:hypothetical protein
MEAKTVTAATLQRLEAAWDKSFAEQYENTPAADQTKQNKKEYSAATKANTSLTCKLCSKQDTICSQHKLIVEQLNGKIKETQGLRHFLLGAQ